MRAPGRFILYTGDLGSPVAVAESEAVPFADYDEPTGMHLALTGTPGAAAAASRARARAASVVRR